ncbi:MAG: ABC transporter permease subunit [Clostridia bacterium]|nr:ABC transporter permease subunit [Clostridia bacterium]
MKRILKYTLIVLFWIGLWWAASAIVGLPLILPSPVDVLIKLGQMSMTPLFWRVMLISSVRVFIGSVLSYVAAFALALICHRVKLLHDIFMPAISVIKTTPVTSFILIAFVLMHRDLIPGLIAALMVFPVVFTNTIEGMRSARPELLETAFAYRLGFLDRAKCIWIPTLRPFMISAAGASVGLAIKAGVAAEVLICPEVSVGKYIFNAKQNMEYVELFAWTVAIVIFSYLLDIAFKLALKRVKRKTRKETPAYEN